MAAVTSKRAQTVLTCAISSHRIFGAIPASRTRAISATTKTAKTMVGTLPPLTPFSQRNTLARSPVVDWGPSPAVAVDVAARSMRITAHAATRRAKRRSTIDSRTSANRDKYPEFDVPDFDNLAAGRSVRDRAGHRRCRRSVPTHVGVAPRDRPRRCTHGGAHREQVRRIRTDLCRRPPTGPPHLGELEAVVVGRRRANHSTKAGPSTCGT